MANRGPNVGKLARLCLVQAADLRTWVLGSRSGGRAAGREGTRLAECMWRPRVTAAQLHVLPTVEGLAQAAALFIAELARERIQTQGR